MEKRWNLLPADEAKVSDLHKLLKINENICRILVQRGVDDFEKARRYFRPDLSQLHSPWLMKDMEKAVARVESALAGQEKILVFGDYDVDGTTAVACMYRFLATLTQNLDFYIPHRYREGYGVSRAGIDFAVENGFTLIISLDCGIKSVDLVDYAAQHGVEFIICDHHLPDPEVPRAVAILNPKQTDCSYPFKELCGCGVGIKLIQAICERKGIPETAWVNLLDLLATAIAADIVPIVGENRIFTYFGLKKVNENPGTGIRALMQLAEQKGEMQVNSLVFVIAPRVNAAGRMDDARKAVLLFLEEDYTQALDLAGQLHTDNTDRRETDSNITEEALSLLDQENGDLQKKTTVLYRSHWHKGVVGIVASRLIEKYYRPTIILTNSGDKVAGSARSVIGFNVYEAIHSCRELLDSYGGHFYAAGLTMKPENVVAFQEKFETVVSSTIDEVLLTPEIVIDTEITFRDITPGLYRILGQMEPFGPQNMRPVFLARHVYETGNSRIVKESHIKFQLKQGPRIMDGIGFGLAAKFDLLQPNVPLDVVFTVEENEWQGEKRLQMKVIDFRESDEVYNA